MKRKRLWLSLAFVSLCITAFLGFSLRSKYLFPLPSIDYRNLLSAHSHFAFGGWVTLALMILFIDSLLTAEQQQRKIYQWILAGIWLTSIGMAASFPFQGYGSVSIPASTLFIFFTYFFVIVFLKDLRRTKVIRPAKWLATAAMVSLFISSVGPFTLAYIMAAKIGNAFLYRDAVYTYLHFQYNGFFTFSVFAILFHQRTSAINESLARKMKPFAVFLISSLLPSLFLSLLWHAYNPYIRTFALLGSALVIITLIFFFRLMWKGRPLLFKQPIARTLLVFSLISFAIKMLLQTGTSIPSLGNAVFGFRPIIIGFLHLVFLGLVTFYILAHLVETGNFSVKKRFSRIALSYFAAAIIINEGILLADGMGLMFYRAYPIYGALLWLASIFLFTSAVSLLIARLTNDKNKNAIATGDGVF